LSGWIEKRVFVFLNKTVYICQLPKRYQNLIRQSLTEKGINKDDIETALNSRLCDLTEVLNIKEVQACFG